MNKLVNKYKFMYANFEDISKNEDIRPWIVETVINYDLNLNIIVKINYEE